MYRGKPQQKTSSLVGLEDKWRRDPFENLLRWQQKGTHAPVQSKEMVQSVLLGFPKRRGGAGLAQSDHPRPPQPVAPPCKEPLAAGWARRRGESVLLLLGSRGARPTAG